MSRYFSPKYAQLVPYTPGEQPKQMGKLVKLNTNECPFPPSEKVAEYVASHTRPLNLYSDPMAAELTQALADTYSVSPEEVIITNGSDEILNFAFMAFCDQNTPAVFPDITYGFYPVFAGVNFLPYTVIPLADDFSIRPSDYYNAGGTIFIANPNAPTGKLLSLLEIEGILRANPDHVVVIDEAYIDFGGESCIPLIHKYSNLLVTQTFSKSRSMAGGRLGYGIACRELICDLNTIKYSTNPYNVNSMTMAAGIATLSEPEYTKKCCDTIIENRTYLSEGLKKRGFEMPESTANFVFARHPAISGEALYLGLKSRGVLVRHFTVDRIKDYNRITVGTRAQIDALLAAIDSVFEEK